MAQNTLYNKIETALKSNTNSATLVTEVNTQAATWGADDTTIPGTVVVMPIFTATVSSTLTYFCQMSRSVRVDDDN